MTTTLCRRCRANPPATARLCIPCWREKITAKKERRHQEERRQRARTRRERCGGQLPDPLLDVMKRQAP